MTAALVIALGIAGCAIAALACLWRTSEHHAIKAHIAYRQERAARLAAEAERDNAIRALLTDLEDITPEDFLP